MLQAAWVAVGGVPLAGAIEHSGFLPQTDNQRAALYGLNYILDFYLTGHLLIVSNDSYLTNLSSNLIDKWAGDELS